MRSARLVDLATTIRSKNAGIYNVTFDVLFDDWERYQLVRDTGVLTPERMAELFNVPLDQVVGRRRQSRQATTAELDRSTEVRHA